MKSFKKSLLSKFFIVLALFAFSLPFVLSAQDPQEGTGKTRWGLIPCGNISSVGNPTKEAIQAQECDFQDLLALGQNIIQFLLVLAIPVAAISFAWAGFLYLSSAGDTSKIKQAKEIFWKVLWGFIFILTAWFIVYMATPLLKEGFSFLLDS